MRGLTKYRVQEAFTVFLGREPLKMAVELKKNGAALQSAFKDVLNNSSETNWAVFGYEGNTNVLKVVETGDGGLEEMVDELSGGKCLYAFMQVTDPNTQLPKNVLVNWQGEGVPPTRKGVCARHTHDVANYFRGAHVTINARSEMDLDEDTVLDKVAKASGANFSFHKEKAKPMPEAGPVGSVYKKANPRADIDARSRDKFWSQQEKDEEHRRTQEKRSAAEERRQLEVERRQREVEQGTARERAADEKGRSLEEQRKRERERHNKEFSAREEALQQRLKQEESAVEAERRREKEEMQRRRVQEYTSISSAVSSKKAGFDQAGEEEPPSLPQRPPKKAPAPAPEPEPEQEWEPEPEQEWEPEPEPEPVQQTWEPEEPAPEEAVYEEAPEEALYDEAAPEEPEQPLYDEAGYQDEGGAEPTPDAAAPVGGGGGEEGLVAVTIYDYEAEDEGELTFDVDERIIDIEKIDEGWWRGTRELDGSNGIFPANYVELID